MAGPSAAIITVDLSCQTPVYVQIIDRIRDLVRSGALLPGAALPSVRQLAADLQINPNTVSKAYLLLEREEIIESRKRRGCFIAPDGPTRADSSADRRLDKALGRLLEEGASLGIERKDLLAALARRLEGRGSVREEEAS